MKYVGVKFRDTKFDTDRLGPKIYVYKTDLDLSESDEVVVETYKGPATAVVCKTNDEIIAKLCNEAKTLDRQIKFVICKFDTEHVEELKAEEARIEFTKAKIKEAYRKKMLNQLADELIAELPELEEEIEFARKTDDLERLLGDGI